MKWMTEDKERKEERKKQTNKQTNKEKNEKKKRTYKGSNFCWTVPMIGGVLKIETFNNEI